MLCDRRGTKIVSVKKKRFEASQVCSEIKELALTKFTVQQMGSKLQSLREKLRSVKS